MQIPAFTAPVLHFPEENRPAVAELQSYLSENLYVPVKQADLSQVLDLSAVPELRANPELQARYLPAIGAALRSGGEA